jgi:glycosyltransferase involved in cell wall biosynthesis
MPVGGVKISACIVALNEENNIRDCLESVKWADEIVVMDALSSDRTVAICREYTDKVFQRPWPGYIAQKNNAISAATHDWVLCLDADERVSQELRDEITGEFDEQGARWDGFIFPRKTFYLGAWIKHGGWYPDYKLRLFRKSKGRWSGVEPHDRVELNGRTKTLLSPLVHNTYRDIAHHLSFVNRYTDVSAEQKHHGGTRFPLLHMLVNPAAKFIKAFVIRGGFLDGTRGFVVAVTSSFYVFLKYAKLWERRHVRGEEPDNGPA